MNRKEPKNSDKKQYFLEINHEILINSKKTEEKSLKYLRKPKNQNNLYK